MGEFTKQEFHKGMLKLNCDSIDKLKKKLTDLRRELDNEDKFRDIYNYAYGFSCEVGRRAHTHTHIHAHTHMCTRHTMSIRAGNSSVGVGGG